MMTCPEVRDLAGLYALEALAEAQRRDLETHLDGCPTCWEELVSLRRVVGVVGYGVPQPTLPPELKARLFRRLEGEPVGAERPARSFAVDPSILGLGGSDADPWRRVALAFGAVVVLACAWGGYQTWQAARYGAERDEMAVAQKQVEERLVRSTAVIRELREERERLALLKAKDVQIMTLSGQRALPGATARLAWSQAEQSWLLTADHLPPAVGARTYQLWAATDKSKVSLGVFQSNPDGRAVLKAFLPEIDGKPMAALVTLEPAGGSPQPTGDIVLMGLWQGDGAR